MSTRAQRIADGVIEAFAQADLELRHDNGALRQRIAELESERDQALIDREVFRRWMLEWAPDMLRALIVQHRDLENLRVRLQALAYERDVARRDLANTGAELRKLRERAA